MEPTSKDIEPIKTEAKPKTAPNLEPKAVETSETLSRPTIDWLKIATISLKEKKPREALLTLSQLPNFSPTETVETPSRESSETDKTTVFSEARKAFGLPKEKSLEQIAEEKESQRKKATKEFLKNKQDLLAKLKIDKAVPLAYQETLQTGKDQVKLVFDTLSTKEKAKITIRRAMTLAKLTTKGIKNPGKVIQIFEAGSGIHGRVNRVNIEDILNKGIWTETETKKAISAFDSIYTQLQNDKFINACQEIGNIPILAERMHEIGDKSFLQQIGTSDLEPLIPMAKRISKIPNEQFRTVLNDLRQYSFLFPNKNNHTSAESLGFKPLIEFISLNSEITTEQRQVLETAKSIYQIGEKTDLYSADNFHSLLSIKDPNLLFSNKERLTDELIVLEQLILECANLDKVANSHEIFSYSKKESIFEHINELAEVNELHALAELLKHGFSIGKDHTVTLIANNMYYIDPPFEKRFATIKEDIRKTESLYNQLSDKSMLSTVLFLDDLLQTQNIKNNKLTIDNGEFFESLINERAKNENVLNIAIDLAKKLTDNPILRTNLLTEFIMLGDNQGPISLNIGSIFEEPDNPEFINKLEPDKQLFWKHLSELRNLDYSWQAKPRDFVFQFLIENNEKFDSFFQKGKFTDNFFYEFTNMFSKLPDKFFEKEDFKKNDFVAAINRFLLDPKYASPCIKGLAKPFRTINSVNWNYAFEVFGTNYNEWGSLSTDGKPNIKFITFLIEKSNKLNDPILTMVANEELTTGLLANLPKEQKAFWKTWKEISNSSLEMPSFLFNNKEKFADFYQDEHITPKLLEAFYNELILNNKEASRIRLDKLVEKGFLKEFPKKDFVVWKAISQSNEESIQFAINNLEKIKNFFNDEGVPSSQLITYLAKNKAIVLQQAILKNNNLNYLNNIEQNFWEEWVSLSFEGQLFFNQEIDNLENELNTMILTKINRLGVFLKKDLPGQKTITSNIAEFEQLILPNGTIPDLTKAKFFSSKQDTKACISNLNNATKVDWKVFLGEEFYEQFLSSLPTLTDEARNAFSHNEYDRTSEFINYIVENCVDDFQLNNDNLALLSDYIKDFGLSKSKEIFHYYAALTRYEQGLLQDLPIDIKNSGLANITELKEKISKLRKVIYSDAPITPFELDSYTQLELGIIKTLIGKDKHRFNYDRPDFNTLIELYKSDFNSGKIIPLSKEYQSERVELNRTIINFNEKTAQPLYTELANEIAEGIHNPNEIASSKTQLQDLLANKLLEIEKSLNELEPNDKKKIYLEKERLDTNNYSAQLENTQTVEEMILFMINLRLGKTERSVSQSIIRQLLFKKLFQKHNSPQFINDLSSLINNKDVTLQSAMAVINVVDSMTKDHLLDFTGDNSEKYWSEKTFKILEDKQNRKAFKDLFSNSGELKQIVDQYKTQEEENGKVITIDMIPDKGFIGEMAGYLADVCYTKEVPLLSKWPVVPYKIVTTNRVGEPEFIGSVLTFDVQDDQGNNCILIRAFNVPNETNYPIPSLIEAYIDKISLVAKKRGFSRIIAAKEAGAISNYQMTINYFQKKYGAEENKVNLNAPFKFNGNNITNDCISLREL